MQNKEIKQHIIYLERQRMNYTPIKYIKKFVKNIDDIYNERNLLKSISFDQKSIEYIVNLIVDALKENKRFKRVECLKIIKRMVKNRSFSEISSKSLIKNLFYIYKEFIFCNNKGIQWAVSTFIKDQYLEDEAIIWLIDNYQESDHVINRLLRYPYRNRFVTEWAKSIYEKGSLNDRLSEVISILIMEDIPPYINADIDVIMWAIYYSKCSIKNKERLILENLDYENYSSSLEVARRLGIDSISLVLLNHYKGLLKK